MLSGLFNRRPPAWVAVLIALLFIVVIFSIRFREPISTQNVLQTPDCSESDDLNKQMAILQSQLRAVQDKQFNSGAEKSDYVAPNLQVSFAPKLPQYEAVSPGQPLHGPDAVAIQASKPLSCPLISTWRGPNVESDSVEARLDKALKNMATWEDEVEKIVALCGNGRPMMRRNEYGFIYAMLRPGDLMLEWGSGRSSCVWAQKVGNLHSIEHDSGWINLLYRQMTLSSNQVIHWMPANKVVPHWTMGSWELYNAYVKLPLSIGPTCYPTANNVKFDVILVDGRARPQCAYQALVLLKPNGILLLHDFESPGNMRPYYRIMMRWYELLHIESALAVFRIKPGKSGVEHHSAPGDFPSWWTKAHSPVDFKQPNQLPHEEPFDKVTAVSGDFGVVKKQWSSGVKAQG